MRSFLKQSLLRHTDPWLRPVLLLIPTLLLFGLTSLTSVEIFFWMFFLSVFIWNLDSRIAIGGALAGLLVIMLLSIIELFNTPDTFAFWREEIAVWTYYFLVIGVLKQLWDVVFVPEEPVAEPVERSIFTPKVPDYSKKQ